MVRVEDDRMGAVVGFVQDHGHRSAGMAAEPDLRSVRALGRELALAQCHASAGADQRPRPLRPDQLPPAVARDGAQLVAAFRDGTVPGVARGGGDLAVDLAGVAAFDQAGDVGVEGLEVRFGADAFAGEVGGEAVLPDEVDALDLALGFGGSWR